MILRFRSPSRDGIGIVEPSFFYRSFTNISDMTHGPKFPASPVGEPSEAARTWWGAVIRHQQYEDGFIFEYAVPIDQPLSFWPRPEMVRLLCTGQWLNTFCEGDYNFLTLWVSHDTYRRIFPAGHVGFEFFTDEETNVMVAESSLRTWLDLNPSSHSVDLRLVTDHGTPAPLMPPRGSHRRSVPAASQEAV